MSFSRYLVVCGDVGLTFKGPSGTTSFDLGPLVFKVLGGSSLPSLPDLLLKPHLILLTHWYCFPRFIIKEKGLNVAADCLFGLLVTRTDGTCVALWLGEPGDNQARLLSLLNHSSETTLCFGCLARSCLLS